MTIVHRETDDGQSLRKYASFKALKSGTRTKKPESDLVFFRLDPADVPDLRALEPSVASLPESERAKVTASETYRELLATLKHLKANNGKKAGTVINDSLPDDGFPANL